MQHRNMKIVPDELPGWQQAMADKHRAQMLDHQMRYGDLGELQTKEQKQRLKAELKKRGVK